MRSGKSLLIAICVFVVVVCASGPGAGLAHDEGVTIDLSVGRIDASLVTDFNPVPLADLQACVDGSAPWSAGRVIDELSRRDNPYPPGYFLIMRAWTALFGVHPLVLRLPSMLFGLAALLGLARLAVRLVPLPHAGGWAALLMALSPWFVSISTFARPYAFVLAVGIWSTVVAVQIAQGGARLRTRSLFVVLSLLGIYGLYHYGFVIAWQMLFMVLATGRGEPGRLPEENRTGERGREWTALVLMGVVIAAGFLPWATRLPAHLELTGSVPSYYLGPVAESFGSKLLRLLWTLFLGEGIAGGMRYWIVLAFLTLGALTLLLLVRRLPSAGPGRLDVIPAVFFATIPLYPALILLGDLLHGTRTLTISKTCFMLSPLLVLVVLRAWATVKRPRLRSPGLVAWVLLLVTASTATVLYQRQMVDHHRAVAATLAQDDAADHFLLLNSLERGHAIPLLLTLQQYGVHDLSVVFAPPPQLDQVLSRTLSAPQVRRVTLLNLYSVYAHDDSTYCSREQLDEVVKRARKSGWLVNRSSPGSLGERLAAGPGDRRMDILSPVR